MLWQLIFTLSVLLVLICLVEGEQLRRQVPLRHANVAEQEKKAAKIQNGIKKQSGKGPLKSSDGAKTKGIIIIASINSWLMQRSSRVNLCTTGVLVCLITQSRLITYKFSRLQ